MRTLKVNEQMRTLKVNEVVHCKTQEQFDKAIIRLNEQGLRWSREFLDNGFSFFNKCSSICLCNSFGNLSYDDIEWFEREKYKIISYNELMETEKWKPMVGKNIWFLSGCNLTVLNEPLTDEHNNKIDLQWSFKTRSLARTARKNMLKCINEQVHE